MQAQRKNLAVQHPMNAESGSAHRFLLLFVGVWCGEMERIMRNQNNQNNNNQNNNNQNNNQNRNQQNNQNRNQQNNQNRNQQNNQNRFRPDFND